MKEKRQTQSFILKRVTKQLKKYTPAIILSLLLAVLSVAGNLLAPVLFGDAIDFIVGEGNVNFQKLSFILSLSARL